MSKKPESWVAFTLPAAAAAASLAVLEIDESRVIHLGGSDGLAAQALVVPRMPHTHADGPEWPGIARHQVTEVTSSASVATTDAWGIRFDS